MMQPLPQHWLRYLELEWQGEFSFPLSPDWSNLNKTLKKIHSFFRGAGGFWESEQGSKADCLFTGIAFPTSISVNNCVCHFSPLKSDQDYILKEGDLVKM